MKLILLFVSVLFTGLSVGWIDDSNNYYHYDSSNVHDFVNQSAVYQLPTFKAAPVDYNLKSEIIDNNAGFVLKSARSYARSRLANLTANFTSYIGQVCKNINTTRLLTTVQLPNATAQSFPATVELTNGKLVDVKSIAPYNDCPGFYGNDSYTLETRMLVHECKVTYDCKLTVLWSTTFKVVALVNDLKVDSKFILNSTSFEITLDYIEIPKGTKIKVNIVNQGAISYVFQQFFNFVFYFTESLILNNAQASAKTFIQQKLKELPKLNNTKPEMAQLKCFGLWLFNS
ncbi:uncharacterized protein LOC111046478 [Nilaparvata lugens]|uniref:uncharacterized protein LOC111046478 n=1 Tax=Nilaparvata lugens TaxID=108931 RepID=UPI00193D396E|nr:uncharacterized protein LOC111046478 [Nilaparvata lugens]